MITIILYIDGKEHGLRLWPVVPRVGEGIEVRDLGTLTVVYVSHGPYRALDKDPLRHYAHISLKKDPRR